MYDTAREDQTPLLAWLTQPFSQMALKGCDSRYERHLNVKSAGEGTGRGVCHFEANPTEVIGKSPWPGFSQVLPLPALQLALGGLFASEKSGLGKQNETLGGRGKTLACKGHQCVCTLF